jgi:hypothetical protein
MLAYVQHNLIVNVHHYMLVLIRHKKLVQKVPLALVDAIRDGRASERKIAERELLNRLRTGNVKA